jgi:hemolysin activation/secretion protein
MSMGWSWTVITSYNANTFSFKQMDLTMIFLARSALLLASGWLMVSSSMAVTSIKDFLPGSIDPSVVSKNLAPAESTAAALQAPQSTQKKVNAPSTAQAQATKFILRKIILKGNVRYNEKTLAQFYQNNLNQKISVAQLQNIIQQITNYYRNNGYILSQAILPPQRIHNGIVEILIVEGFINHVQILGRSKGAKELLQSYGDVIAATRPLDLKILERNLRLANEISGLQTQAIFEPAKKTVGASDLNLISQMNNINGYLSYDNYGTRYIGPNQITGSITANSIFRSGDNTRFVTSTTPHPQQLKFYDLFYETPFASGARINFGTNRSTTHPGFVLKSLKIQGNASTYYGNLSYALLRSRSANLTIDGGFNYVDSKVASDSQPLYSDHVRKISLGGTYDFADRWSGYNTWVMHVEQGLNIFGASNDPTSTLTSRFGADSKFTKVLAQSSRLQALYGPLSIYFNLTGQYVFRPVLATDQFSFGGSQLGRGYDSSEIIGDRGIAGTLEFRLMKQLNYAYLQAMQPYIFYDIGTIWNLKNMPNIIRKQSAASTGFGIRCFFMKNLAGNFMFAQPLTKKIATRAALGNGKTPRLLFSLVASL